MMQMTQGWNRLRNVAIALGLFALTGSGVKADGIQTSTSGILTYSTSGFVIGTQGVTGTNVITYGAINGATVNTDSNLPLGEFQVAPLGASQSTTYVNTPFQFTLIPSAYNGSPISDASALSGQMALTVKGVLNGTETGNSQSNLIATINPISSQTFLLGSATSTLAGLPSEVLLVPSSAGGITTLEGAINTVGSVNPPPPVPAPEPSTIALFLSTVGGLALRRYVLARRGRAVA
jgi:hypothetical protein